MKLLYNYHYSQRPTHNILLTGQLLQILTKTIEAAGIISTVSDIPSLSIFNELRHHVRLIKLQDKEMPQVIILQGLLISPRFYMSHARDGYDILEIKPRSTYCYNSLTVVA